MMAKLLLVLPISVILSAAIKIQAEVVDWPSGYTVDWSRRDRESRSARTVKQYFSQKEKAYRWDIDDGANTYILTSKDENTSGIYYLFPKTNDTVANVTNCIFVPYPALKPGEKIFNNLPELTGFSLTENVTINGSPAEKWIREKPNKHFHEKRTVWLKRDNRRENPIPVRVEVEIRGRFDFEDDYVGENFAVDFYDYQPKEPEKNVWLLPKNVDCQRADQDTKDLIFGYVVYELDGGFRSQLSQNTTKIKKGLKRVDTFRKSALPFPYTDEDIQIMASQLPDTFDWRNHGAVTSVKNQGMCGSCWAFGITGAMEGAYFLKNGNLGYMSEQALVDCGWIQDQYGSINGCFGGDSGTAIDWIAKHGGLPWAEEYGDYKAINGRCTLNHVQTHGAILGFVHVTPNVDAVKVALYHRGPLTVSISTPAAFEFYINGVIKNDGVPRPIDHSILLIGYGSLNGDDYWLIKNSWGEGWGLSGYGLISMENNTLNLLNDVYYPEMI